MVSPLTGAMAEEWLLPQFMLCGGFTDNLVISYTWYEVNGQSLALQRVVSAFNRSLGRIPSQIASKLRHVFICPTSSRFSSGGTRSVLHTDAHDNLHCLVSGVKEFVLIDPQYIDTIGPEHRAQGFYNIDVDQ